MSESSGFWNECPLAGLSRISIEFPHGCPLSPEKLDLIRRQVEEGFEVTAAVGDEIRGVTAVSVVGCVVAGDDLTYWQSFRQTPAQRPDRLQRHHPRAHPSVL